MTYEIKYRKEEDMKNSGIEWLGKVPKESEITRIKYISDLIMGQSPDSNQVNQNGLGIPFLQGKAEFGDKHPQAINYCTKPKKNSEIDDILISVRAPVGELNISDISYCIGRGLAAIRGNSNNNEYLFYSLLSYKDALVSYSTGTTFESVNISQIENLTTLKLDSYNQQKIGNFLDFKTSEFDSIIDKKEKLIVKLEEAKKSLISEVVTGKVKVIDGEIVERKAEEMKDSGVEWLGIIPKDWMVSRLRYECWTTKGFAFNSKVFEDRGHPIVRASEIKKGTISDCKTFIKNEDVKKYSKVKLKTNDIIMSTVGSTPDVIQSAVGQLAKVPLFYDGALLNQNTVIIRTNIDSNIDNDYLYYLISGNKYRRFLDLHAHGTANQASLSLKDILEYPIGIPKNSEQHEIIKYLQENLLTIDNILYLTKLQIQKLKFAKQSLISEAVTGKIDLSHWEII